MSTSRSSAPTEEPKPANNLLPHVFYSTVGTLTAHPCRVFLNQAYQYRYFFETIAKGYPYIWGSLGYNFARGTASASAQSFFKSVFQERHGFAAGVAASAVTGTIVASLLETPLIRKNNSPVKLPLAALWRFSLPLTSLYFLREIGFTLAVLAKDDMPSPLTQQAVLLGGTVVTGGLHKLAAVDASRDLDVSKGTQPDFRQGIRHTIRAMANGNVYTHQAFQVNFKNPQNYAMMARNLFSVACGKNVFLFRYAYLLVFSNAYSSAKKFSATINGFFHTPSTELPTSNEIEKQQPSITNGKN